MVSKEKELAKAIMRGDSRIELSEELKSCVEKVKEPSQVVWYSVAAVFATATFFGTSGLLTGMMIGLPAVLSIAGGAGGIALAVLGMETTVFCFRMVKAADTSDVLSYIRDKYNLTDTVMTRK